MAMSATVELTPIEEELIQVVRTLPPERVAQLIDFARFLAFQIQAEQEGNGWDAEEAPQVEATLADDERWDRLLSRPDAKELMLKMAQEALEEHRTGQTVDITVTHDGRLAPA